jgi:hypothetical protein
MILGRYTHRTAPELKADRAILIDVLQEGGAKVRGNAVSCPFHDDKHPSAGVYLANGEGYRFKCHSCGLNGSALDLIAILDGLTVPEVLRRLKGDSKPQKPPTIYADIESLKAAMSYPVEEVYQYTHPATGKIEMLVFRLKTPDGKTFRQASPVLGGYVQQAPPKPWPLYHRSRVKVADTIVVVEGERKVHTLHDYGVTATTSPAGAGKAPLADWTPLAGRNVILWGDNDEPGRAHMAQVEVILQRLEPAPRIAILEPADLDLQEKEDVVDFVGQLETRGTGRAAIQEAILAALSRAKPKGVASGLSELIEATIRGERIAVKWPWRSIGGLTKALMPGCVTLLCGNVGASKSFMLLEAGAYWHEAGIKTAIFELEEDRDYHLSRCLAQQSQTADATDPDWIRDKPEQARKLFAEHKDFLESFGACIYAIPETQPTLSQVAQWAQDRAKAGGRIIGIDPITAAAHIRQNLWEEDGAFLASIKRTAIDYQCSIILVTHPIKTVSNPDVTQLAGGAAFQRFSQTVLWLESHSEKTSKVKTSCGTTEVDHNRTLHLLKARNGRGQGLRLACSFQAESLRLKELGAIVKEGKTSGG